MLKSAFESQFSDTNQRFLRASGCCRLGGALRHGANGRHGGGRRSAENPVHTLLLQGEGLRQGGMGAVNALAAKVSGARTESKELPAGFAFRLRSDQVTLGELGEWTGYVHRCCPFLDYEIAVHRDGSLWVTIKGGEAAKPFIRSEFARLFVGHTEGEEMRSQGAGPKTADSEQ